MPNSISIQPRRRGGQRFRPCNFTPPQFCPQTRAMIAPWAPPFYICCRSAADHKSLSSPRRAPAGCAERGRDASCLDRRGDHEYPRPFISRQVLGLPRATFAAYFAPGLAACCGRSTRRPKCALSHLRIEAHGGMRPIHTCGLLRSARQMKTDLDRLFTSPPERARLHYYQNVASMPRHM
jgi:hypothetical protein